MSLRFPARDNVDLQQESLENPRNVVILWESPVGSTTVAPSDNDYTLEGLLVYTDNADVYRLWRRNATAFTVATDNTISPDGDFSGRGPYWEEIELAGGRDFQIGQTAPTTNSSGGVLVEGDEWLDSTSGSQYTWIVADTPANSNWVQTSGAGDQSGAVAPGAAFTQAQGDARYFQQTNNLSEVQDAEQARTNLGVVNGIPLWAAGELYAVGATFYTSGDTNLFTDESVRNTIFRVAAAYLAGNTLTQAVVDAGTIVPIGSTGGGTGGDHTPYWSADALYDAGDIVAQRIPANPPAFPNSATFTFVYNGADGTNTGAPVDPTRVTNPGTNNYAAVSRDWLTPAGVMVNWRGTPDAPFPNYLSFSQGSFVTYNREIYRARVDVLRPTTNLSGNDTPDIDPTNWELVAEGNAAILIGQNEAGTADIPEFDSGINRAEWDLFNRINIGFPLLTSGDTQLANRSAQPIFINSDTTTGYDQALAMRNLFDVRFNNLTDVAFEDNINTFNPPRFNGQLISEAAVFQSFATEFRDGNAATNPGVLSFEIQTDSNFQRSELELDFAAGNPFVIESSLNPGLTTRITGDCLAPQFLAGSSSTLLDRVRINLQVDNVQAAIDNLTGYTDSAGETWGQSNIGGSGVYEFGIGDDDAVQQAFTADLLTGLEIQITRNIVHQWAFYDQAGTQLRVTDAAEMRDQLQTQPTDQLLSVSTQFPTAPGSPSGEGRENQIPTVRGLDSFMANGNLRSLVEVYDPADGLPTTFSGWLLKNSATNLISYWVPTTAALTANEPRSAGTYEFFGGTPRTVVVTSVPTTAPNAEDPSNIRILNDRSAVYLFVGPNDTDWVNIQGGGDGQVGFSMEQLGILTAGTIQATENNTYRWPPSVEANFGGLNDWGFNGSNTQNEYVNANPTAQELFDNGAIFTNSTGSAKTIASYAFDYVTLANGDGGTHGIQLTLVHRVTDPNDGTFTYNLIRSREFSNSRETLVTLTDILPTPFEVANGDAISMLITGAIINQSLNFTGVRFSSSRAAWLNTVQPIGSDGGTTVSANPIVTDADPELSSITIGDIDYRVLGDVDNRNIAPSSVRLGGTTGTHVLEEVDAVSRSTQVGSAVTTTALVQASSNSLITGAAPTGISTATTDYILNVATAGNELPTGDYLVTSNSTSSTGQFSNIRPIVNGATQTALSFTADQTISGFEFSLFAVTMDAATGFRLVNTGPDPDVNILMATANDVIDFTSTPTVNGTSLALADTGIQRIITDLPIQTQAIPNDTSIVYNLLIDTSIANNNNIAVRLFGIEVANLDNVNLPTTHLAIGDNVFTFTLTATQIGAWNNNAISATPSFGGFEIRNNVDAVIEFTRDSNQFFLGSGEDNSAGIQENHRDIVNLQTAEGVLDNRLTTLEGEVHQLESNGRRVTTTFHREVSSIDQNTIDEVTLYYRREDTSQTTPITFGATVSGINENAVFTSQSHTIGGNIISRLDTHLNNVNRVMGSYVRTRSGGQAPETIPFTGQIVTSYATIELSNGTDTITFPMEVNYDGQGDAHHVLYFPFPANATINYTTYTVRYFVNNFLNADGSDNTNSSVNLVAHGFASQISIPFGGTDRGLLNTDFNTNTANGQFHFVQQDGTPVSYAVASFGLSSLVPIYAGYLRANVNLTGFNSSTATDPGVQSIGTMVVNGVESSANVPFAVGTNGIVNAPTQEEVTANEFLRADNTWASMIIDTFTITDSTDTWTWTADAATRSLTLSLNGTNSVRFQRDATTGHVDLIVTGDIISNQQSII